MDSNTTQSPDYSESLSISEKMVLNAVLRQKAQIDDVPSIAKVCRLSEIQAGVAVQLLTHKKLFPEQNSSAD